MKCVIEVSQPMDAKELLKRLNDPNVSSDASKVGWDVSQLRIECESALPDGPKAARRKAKA